MIAAQTDPIVIPISFSTDGLTLKGYLHLPVNSVRPPVVIGSHGLFSDGGSPKQIALAVECNRLGMAYFRFHHRGCGASEGEFVRVTSLENRCRDLRAAIETVTVRSDIGPRWGVFGSSVGGATALALAGRIPVTAIAILAAPVCSEPILHAAKITGDLRGMSVSFYERNLSFDLMESLYNISTILIIHGEADGVVPVSNAFSIHQHVGEPKKLIVQPNGDHRVSNPKHQAQFLRETAAWFHRWLH